MPVFILKLLKGITHKQFKLFEFRQLEHLLESCATIGVVFTQEKLNNSGGWLGFDGLGVLYRKGPKLFNLPCLYNFACSQTSPIVKHDI